MNSAEQREWVDATRDRARLLQSQLSRLEASGKAQNVPEALRERMLEPYRRLLENVYVDEMPIAQLVDNADLLVHVHGQAADAPTPKLTLLSRLMSEFRDAVGSLAKVVSGAEALRLPDELELRFAGIARGSLFLGFNVEPSTSPKAEGSTELSRAASTAIRHMLEIAPGIVSENAAALQVIEDPAERDTVVAVLHKLSPSGKIGVREIDLYARGGSRPATLTVDTRRHARSILSKPFVELTDAITLVGTVREVDLDQQRFELRNVHGRPDVRCALELSVDEAHALLNRRVRVSGRPELGRGAKAAQVRLMWVDEYEVLE